MRICDKCKKENVPLITHEEGYDLCPECEDIWTLMIKTFEEELEEDKKAKVKQKMADFVKKQK